MIRSGLSDLSTTVKRRNEDRYLVTVKLPRSPIHDPQNKVIGDCPVSGKTCTDITGEHHTLIFAAPVGTPLDRVTSECKQRFGHVTRIEEV